MSAKLIENSRSLRDKEKRDGVLESIFHWVAGEDLVVTLGGGVRFTNRERILECLDDDSRPYLRLARDASNSIKIDAHFDDADGNSFMSVADNRLKVHTSDIWDIVISRRRIRFEHADRRMILSVQQGADMELRITGKLYLNGGYYEIFDDRIVNLENGGMEVLNCRVFGPGPGVLLAPGAFCL